MKNKRKKICIVATVPFALIMFMKPHIVMLSEHYDVTLIANGKEGDVDMLLGKHVRFISVKISRKISLWSDIVTLYKLYTVFRKAHYDVVHSLTPKAGLLAMLAAYVARVPNRIHTFTGQVWANKSGMARWMLKTLDKSIAWCATSLLTDSVSQRRFLTVEHIVKEEKIVVLGNGSACGVDPKRFKPNMATRHQIRNDLSIPDSAIVYLFLGRLNKDKGIQDLALAFSELADHMPHIHLLVVGPDESNMDMELRLILGKYLGQFHRVGFTNKPEDYMACADIFCLPSYREGFGSVLIEAAAVCIPAVASRIYGITDAVVDGETGLLHQPKNIEEIKCALLTLSNNLDLRERMSKQAMARAHDLFSIDVVVGAMRQYYKNMQ